MSAAPKYVICIGAGILTEVGVFFVSVMATFAGCGSAPLPREFAFVTPYYMMVSKDSTPVSIITVVSVITLLQMPIYGWILGSGWVHHRFWRHFLILVSVHIIAGFIGYWIHTRA